MIKIQTPVSMAEVEEIIKNSESENKELVGFIKKFIKINAKDAQKLKEELNELKILQLKESHIAKIIDMMPEDSTDLNKLLSDVILNDDEKSKILGVVKKYK